MDESTRRQLIDRYREGYQQVADALAGITEEQLDAVPKPGAWSARQIVHHLADSEMTAAIRLRLLLAVDGPRIQGYDQEQFARRLHYDRPYEPSLVAFKAARECTVPLLERLSPEEWGRRGTHTEVGPYSVEGWLQIYAEHAHQHADQIRRARAAAGAGPS